MSLPAEIPARCRQNSADESESDSDRSAGLLWKSTGKRPSDEALSYDGVSLLAFDDEGKIARFQGFYDMRQLTLKGASH